MLGGMLMGIFIFSGCDSDSTSSDGNMTYSDVYIVKQEDLRLSSMLDMPLQIIHTQNALDVLVDDMAQHQEDNTTSYKHFSVDFSTDIVVYLQRYTNDGIHIVTLEPQSEGIRVSSSVSQDVEGEPLNSLRGTLLVLKNGKNVPLFFTKKTQIRRSCESGIAYLVGSATPADISSASLLYKAKSNESNSTASDILVNEDELNQFSQTYFDGAQLLAVDWEQSNVISSGVFYADETTSYTTPKLTDAWYRKGVYCDFDSVPRPEAVIWNFSINGYRSDCSEYRSQEPMLSLYEVPKDMNITAQTEPVLTMQSLSVKSCTGFTDTPRNGQMDWFDDKL